MFGWKILHREGIKQPAFRHPVAIALPLLMQTIQAMLSHVHLRPWCHLCPAGFVLRLSNEERRGHQSAPKRAEFRPAKLLCKHKPPANHSFCMQAVLTSQADDTPQIQLNLLDLLNIPPKLLVAHRHVSETTISLVSNERNQDATHSEEMSSHASTRLVCVAASKSTLDSIRPLQAAGDGVYDSFPFKRQQQTLDDIR
jgi:hypothetical protein